MARTTPEGPCAVDGCTKDAAVKGWCRNHYRYWWLHGEEFKPVRRIKCRLCPTTFEWTVKAGPRPVWCEECRPQGRRLNQNRWQAENRDRVNEAQRRYHRENAQANRRRQRLHRYGLTDEDYQELLDRQGERCAICNTGDPGAKGWCIDHCHATGVVRGLVCRRCNTGMGLFDDDPHLMAVAVAYLQEASRVVSPSSL